MKRGHFLPRRSGGFIDGMGRVLDIGGTVGRSNLTKRFPPLSDRDALRSDWVAVGKDLENAINAVANDAPEMRAIRK